MSPAFSSGDDKSPAEIAEAEARLTDLHYAIFKNLPTQGMNVGLQPMVITVKLLVAKLRSEGAPSSLTSGTLMAELQVMAKYDLTIRVQKLSGHTLGWQKTRRAEELLAARENQETEALPEPEYQRPLTPEKAEEISRRLEVPRPHFGSGGSNR